MGTLDRLPAAPLRLFLGLVTMAVVGVVVRTRVRALVGAGARRWLVMGLLTLIGARLMLAGFGIT